MAKASAGNSAKPKASSKTVIYQKLAEATKMSKKDVSNFMDHLTTLIKNELEIGRASCRERV